MNKYYALTADNGSQHIFSPEAAPLKPPEGEWALEFVVEAWTWEEAMAIYSLRRGWAPYKPGEPGHCPKCSAVYYPEGSGECWRCNQRNAGSTSQGDAQHSAHAEDPHREGA